MKAYSVHFNNKEESWRTGAVDQKLLILAEDITSAMMYAQEQCDTLIEKLIEAEIPNTETVRVTSIVEEYFAVTGNIGINYTKDSIKSREEWMDDLVKRVKARE